MSQPNAMKGDAALNPLRHKVAPRPIAH